MHSALAKCLWRFPPLCSKKRQERCIFERTLWCIENPLLAFENQKSFLIKCPCLRYHLHLSSWGSSWLHLSYAASLFMVCRTWSCAVNFKYVRLLCLDSTCLCSRLNKHNMTTYNMTFTSEIGMILGIPEKRRTLDEGKKLHDIYKINYSSKRGS